MNAITKTLRRLAPVLALAIGCGNRTLSGSEGDDADDGGQEADADAEAGSSASSETGASSETDATASDDSGTSAPSCPDPTSCDPYNCGPSGLLCPGTFGVGECVDGECGPYLVGCTGSWNDPTSCTQVCASVGSTCAVNGCAGATLYGWPEAYEVACLDDIEDGSTPVQQGCDILIDFSNPATEMVQCCCDDP